MAVRIPTIFWHSGQLSQQAMLCAARAIADMSTDGCAGLVANQNIPMINIRNNAIVRPLGTCSFQY
jgi:hypothetical protein